MNTNPESLWWTQPRHLEVRSHCLTIGGIEANELADKFGTPLYVYNLQKVSANYRLLEAALAAHSSIPFDIYYAVKANSHPQLLKTLAGLGAGADVSSPGEASLALSAGFPRERMLFTGASVSTQDMAFMIEKGIGINVDSLSQIKRLSQIPGAQGVPLAFRHNPGIGAGASGLITAGAYAKGVPNKFGLAGDTLLEAWKAARELGLNPVGIHQHLGSGWTSQTNLRKFLRGSRRTVALAREISESFGDILQFVDFGGGLGYRCSEKEAEPPTEDYCSGLGALASSLKDVCQRAIIEPGGFLAGPAGILLTRVTMVETKGNARLVGVDSGFNVFNCPSLYHHPHHIVLTQRADAPPDGVFTVVGNLCEPGDYFALNHPMPAPEEGALVAILATGAYGAVMSSNYNGRPQAREVLLWEGSVSE